MFKNLLIFLVLAFCFSTLSEGKAQTLIKDSEIPDDLIITLNRTGRFEDNTTTIKANGDWTYEGYSGLPRQNSFTLLNEKGESVVVENKPVPTNGFTKVKLEKSRIKSLISEFEKIQFLRFGNGFPTEDGGVLSSTISDQSTEMISIQINGQKKVVSNYLGSFGIKNKMLSDLANKIRETIFWNVPQDKIPEDLAISYGHNFGESWNQYVINSDGIIFYKSLSNMPSNPNRHSLLIDKTKKPIDKTKKPKLKDKLSKEDLRLLISEFESIGSANFPNEVLSRKEGCTNEFVTTHLRTTGISLHMKGKTLSASFDTSCNPVTDSIAAKIETLSKKFEEMLKNVKVTKANNSENKK